MYGYRYSNELEHIVGVEESEESCKTNPSIIENRIRIMMPEEVYDKNDNEIEKIGKLFRKAQGFWDYEDGESEGIIVVNIRGDWKHDHAFCDTLMGSLGYSLEKEIRDDYGSDFYSSQHIYVKTEK